MNLELLTGLSMLLILAIAYLLQWLFKKPPGSEVETFMRDWNNIRKKYISVEDDAALRAANSQIEKSKNKRPIAFLDPTRRHKRHREEG
ncbi:hypothetical protein [Leptospira santarosai]|uniref:hypothetical protein n=1 Tax=Leptospira santarosai TaxID=28183 RepID=UPI0024AF8DF0|nr:hypothetical protein [Leptospira santarosai]MDI7165940.1 hypothetical protein [Leptospira santarosai]